MAGTMDSSARLHAANGLALQLAARASAFRHGLQLARIVPAEADASQALPVDRHVQAASEALWEDITSLHSGLLRTDAPLASEVNPHRRLLEAKIAQFQAELDTIRSTDVGRESGECDATVTSPHDGGKGRYCVMVQQAPWPKPGQGSLEVSLGPFMISRHRPCTAHSQQRDKARRRPGSLFWKSFATASTSSAGV